MSSQTPLQQYKNVSMNITLPNELNKSFHSIAEVYLEWCAGKTLSNAPVIVHFNDYSPFELLFEKQTEVAFRTGCNLKSLEIVSLEIADTVYTNQNNLSERQIFWVNQDEPDHVYTATCNVGAYDVTGFVRECLRAMSSVTRKNGTLHQWYVSNDIVPANAISFYNVEFQPLQPDALSTTSESSEIVVTAPNHGLSVGDFVTFRGVVNNPGAINNDIFNDASLAVSKVVDQDHFSTIVSAIAYTTSAPSDQAPTGYGGGPNIMLGTGSYFAFVKPTDVSEKIALELVGFPPSSGINVALQYGLTVDVFCQHPLSVTLPAQFLKDHPTISRVSFLGLKAVGLSSDYDIINGALLPVDMVQNNVSTDVLRKRLRQVSMQNRSRVLMTSIGASFARVQSNVYDTGSLYQGINLTGDTYCFLVETQLDKVIAKIQLRAGVGYVDFDTFVNMPFTPAELALLQNKKKLQCVLKTAKNEVLYYQNMKVSGTIRLRFEPPLIPTILTGLVE